MDIRLVLLCLSVFVVTVYCEHFTNKFAVHIPGGEHRAREVASKHGYVHFGQIGTLEDHYLFEHPHVHRRSVEHNRDHHEHLTNHPHVAWFEQQVVKSRKKRDYIPMPSHVNSGEKMVSKRETVSKQDLKFNDQLWDKMWYFHGGGLNHTDMNVMGAWKRGVTGKNVVITILDDGIERTHDDLKDNYDPYASYDVNGHDSDPMPRYDYTNENRHGTRCAGEVSAKANNTKCIVGVAYDSKIGGVRMLDGDVYDAVEATSLSHNRSHIDIYSASWGPDDDGRVVDGPGVLAKKAFIDGVRLGRNGKGSIFVWASGNGGNQKDSCNCDGYTDSIYTLSISSISQHGREPWYLEECSSTLATTYSSGTYNEKQIGRDSKGAIFVWASGNGGRMHDSCSCDGYTNSIFTMSISGISQRDNIPFYLEECASTIATTYSSGSGSEQKVITVDLHNKCTETHTGTSASAPLAAGIVALILEVKPSLTWRDVQYVTLMTSRPLPDGTWVTNGVGRQVSLRYGYGLMDATAMVELAEKWTNVPPQHICEVRSKTFKASPRPKIDIPASGKTDPLDTDACAGTTKAINYLEHVQVKITMKGKRRGDIVIHITSPMGTKSTILPKRPNDSDKVKGFDGWAFLSVHFWGENPVGVWTLQVDIASTPRSNIYSGSYSGGQTTNDLLDWSLIMYGTEENPVNLVNPTPHVTDKPEPTKSGVTTSKPTTTIETSTTIVTTAKVTTTTIPPLVTKEEPVALTTVTVAMATTLPLVIETTQPPVKNCHSQCLADCSGPGANQCGACKSYRIQATGTCVQSCPNNYYADEFNCKSCDQTCDTCTYISSNKVMCLKCKAGYLLVEGKGTCESFCEKGYYKEEESHHCRVCSGMCAACTENAHKCTDCRTGFQLINNKCIPYKEPCPPGQYQTEGGCVPCPAGCFSCSSATNCTCCNKGSYLQNGNCVHSCDNGYLPFHVNYSSKFVFQQCQHCDDNCNVCPDGFTYMKGVCVQQSNCADGTYFQWNSMSCKSCNTSCKSCIGPSYSDCLSCYPPRGYNNLLRKCMLCCSRTDAQARGKADCCNCIEEGKCDIRSQLKAPEEDLGSVSTIIIVLLVVIIGALLIFILVFACVGCKSKQPHKDVSYSKLLENDLDMEDA